MNESKLYLASSLIMLACMFVNIAASNYPAAVASFTASWFSMILAIKTH